MTCRRFTAEEDLAWRWVNRVTAPDRLADEVVQLAQELVAKPSVPLAITSFTNGEEEEVQLTHVVPFLVEDELKRLGAHFEKGSNWQPLSIVDGCFITGQNPASSTGTAQALLKLVGQKETASS